MRRHRLFPLFLTVVTVIASIALFAVVAVAHELLVMLAAVALPIISGLEILPEIIAILPVNFVYASAMVRYLGEIQPAGLALTGDLGVELARIAPGFVFDPTYVAGDGIVSTVIAPGSSLVARSVASGFANVVLMAVGIGASVIGARIGKAEGARHISDMGSRARLILIVAAVIEFEVVARVLRSSGSTRDLESLGVLPFIFHQLLRLHREFYDRVSFYLSQYLDPVFSIVALVGLFGVFILVWAGWSLLRSIRIRGTVNQATSSDALAQHPLSAKPTTRTSRFVIETSLAVILFAALPIGDLANNQTRYLEWEIGAVRGSSVDAETLEKYRDSTSRDDTTLPQPPVSVPFSESIVAVEAVPIPTVIAPVARPTVAAAAAPPVTGARVETRPTAISTAVPTPIPTPISLIRGSQVGIGGRGYVYTYVVNGMPTEMRGMGYNITYAELPKPERIERLRRDFTLMREVGINTILGWGTSGWDETVLDAAEAAGIGVVMPFDLDDKLDYSDRNVRSRLRSDVLAWVTRYRYHPAIRMWGIGNETLLHMKQPARVRAFADFYTGLVDVVRQYDPDHPVIYREAEDIFVRSLEEVWKTRGGSPPGFVVGMNFYTFRLRDAINDWPKRAMDAPIIISEFAPAGIGRGERAAGYWQIWGFMRTRPDLVLGGAPYVWNVEGVDPSDRLFGLVEKGRPVDSTLGTIRDIYKIPVRPTDEKAPFPMPALVGLQQTAAEQVIRQVGLKLEYTIHQYPSSGVDQAAYRRFGLGNVISQDPEAGTQLARGAHVRLAVAASPQLNEIPISRSIAQ